MKFKELMVLTHEQRETTPYRGTLVCFDPGETTGYAVFENGALEDSSQLDTRDISKCTKLMFDELEHHKYPELKFASRNLESKLSLGKPREVKVVIEDYRVYGWKTESHAWENLHTPKLIGGIQTVCGLLGVPYHMQMAGQVKTFCTNDKLKEWDMYQTGQQHARDAIRHGCYYLLFNKPDKDVK
jgi:hypothetical protein